MSLNRTWVSEFAPLQKLIFNHWKTVSLSFLNQCHPRCSRVWNLPECVSGRWRKKEKSLLPQKQFGGGQAEVFSAFAEEMTRRKWFCVSGTMWNSKIRKTVANLSIKAGNMIHLFPFMQTQVYEGLCENYFSPAESQRPRIRVLLLATLAFLSFSPFSSLSCFWRILWPITPQV